MNGNINYFINEWIKLFFLLTPFFTLSVFLSFTSDMDKTEKNKVALRVTIAIIIICFFLYWFGNFIFSVFGITLDSFRIGAGALLFISSIKMVYDNPSDKSTFSKKDDFAVVPLAIPITVGPATTGALLVMGAEIHTWVQLLISYAALVSAAVCTGSLLFLSSPIKKLIGDNGFTILGKLTGLILSALAAQIIFTGIKNFLKI